MTIMAAACGILIVVLGLWSAGRNPTEIQSAVETSCLVGGLILCFLAVVLARLTALSRRLDGFEVVAPEGPEQPAAPAPPAPQALATSTPPASPAPPVSSTQAAPPALDDAEAGPASAPPAEG